MAEENKRRAAVWLTPGVIRRMDGWLEEDNCKIRSEFIEKALRFYMGYMATEDTSEYLSRALVDTLRGYIGRQRKPAEHPAVQAVRGGEYDGPHRGRPLPGRTGEPLGAAGLCGGRGAAYQREDQL